MRSGKLTATMHLKGIAAYLVQMIVTVLVFITVISFSMPPSTMSWTAAWQES